MFNTQIRRLAMGSTPVLVAILAMVSQLSPRPWPGQDDARAVDPRGVFEENLSGIAYEKSSGGEPVMWAVQNRPGMLFRMKQAGDTWAPDPLDGWKSGRLLHYPDGKGSPDAEGIALVGSAASEGIYVATERNNDSNSRSRNSILRFDATSSGAGLTATAEWDLTADLPRTGPNEGIESIAWVPDSYLVEQRFHDDAAGRAYNPADYPDHGSGLFLVGLEATGEIFVYALNHANRTYKRIATMKSGLPHVMVLEFDRELNNLWAVCDNGCETRAAILKVAGGGGNGSNGAAAGRFTVTSIFSRPRSLPNVNNEGFAVAPQSECRNGYKPVFWSDDSNTDGHSIRSASVTCAPFNQ